MSAEAAQEVRGRAARHLLMQFDEGELRGPINRDDEMEPALRGSDLGDVDMEIADRVSLELTLGRSFAFDPRQQRDSMTLQATMQRRARQMRDRRLQGVKAIVERQQRTMASSSTDRTVDLGFFGPVGRSKTEARFLHLATFLGSIP